MKDHNLSKLAFSASLICLAGGCASGPQAVLQIRNVEQTHMSASQQNAVEQGRYLLGLRQNADAISAFRRALRETPDNPEAFNGLAIAYDRIGRRDLAQRYFELAVAADPVQDRYKVNLARFFERGGQPELAQGLIEPLPEIAEVARPAAATVESVVQQVEFVPAIAAVEVDGTLPATDPIAAIIARLVIEPEMPLDEDDAAPLKLQPSENMPATANKLQSRSAAFRPQGSLAIEAMPIKLPDLPLPDRRPNEEIPAFPVDLPRSTHIRPSQNGPYIERTSLGEVRLVTMPTVPASSLVSGDDRLGQIVAQVVEEDQRKAKLDGRASVRSKLAIREALERAAVEEAVTHSTSLASLSEKMDQIFVYAFFDEDSLVAPSPVA